MAGGCKAEIELSEKGTKLTLLGPLHGHHRDKQTLEEEGKSFFPPLQVLQCLSSTC